MVSDNSLRAVKESN